MPARRVDASMSPTANISAKAVRLSDAAVSSAGSPASRCSSATSVAGAAFPKGLPIPGGAVHTVVVAGHDGACLAALHQSLTRSHSALRLVTRFAEADVSLSTIVATTDQPFRSHSA